MSEPRFKEKDRVVGKDGVLFISGKVGTVVCITTGPLSHGIQFDEPVEGGHDLGRDLYKAGYCRWVNDNELEPYNEAPYFADARVGDSVEEMALGKGRIEEIDPSNMRPLRVVFNGRGGSYYFTLDGKIPISFYQTLFYSRPVFELPPPPKRKVKKVVEGWVMFDPRTLRNSKEEAEHSTLVGTVLKAAFIHHEYEEIA